jgi:hypothetical protein
MRARTSENGFCTFFGILHFSLSCKLSTLLQVIFCQKTPFLDIFFLIFPIFFINFTKNQKICHFTKKFQAGKMREIWLPPTGSREPATPRPCPIYHALFYNSREFFATQGRRGF